MKTKNILISGFVILFLMQSKLYAQEKWHLWHKEKGVSLYYAYIPETKYGDYPYFLLKVVNNAPREMSMYAKFDLVNDAGQPVTNYDPINVNIPKGKSIIIRRRPFTVTHDLVKKYGNIRLSYRNLWIR